MVDVQLVDSEGMEGNMSDVLRRGGRWRAIRPALQVPLTALVGVVLGVGCTPTGDTPQAQATSPFAPAGRTHVTDPCDGPPAQLIDLGSPYRTTSPASFSVQDTGPLWVTASTFATGGPFDPANPTTAIDIGPADVVPTYDEQRSAVPDATLSTRVDQGTFSEVVVEPGEYWIWSSAGGDVQLAACQQGTLGAFAPSAP